MAGVITRREEEIWKKDTKEGSHVMMGTSWNRMNDDKEASIRQANTSS